LAAVPIAAIAAVATTQPAGADTVGFSSAQIGTTGSTAQFNQIGPWTMAWSFDCSSFGTAGNFIVSVNQPPVTLLRTRVPTSWA
jgi:hypothetical protein